MSGLSRTSGSELTHRGPVEGVDEDLMREALAEAEHAIQRLLSVKSGRDLSLEDL